MKKAQYISVIIKEAEKASAVVVWDLEDCRKEAGKHVNNEELYGEVNKKSSLFGVHIMKALYMLRRYF